jgi:SAM-dependent methyltransferase
MNHETAPGMGYEALIGRWSRGVAREFLAWLDVPSGSRWLDVGCGTGALCRAILDMAAPELVLGLDLDVRYLGHAREESRPEQAHFVLGDARALPCPDEACDAAVAGLLLHFVPEPEAVLAEMARVTRLNGTVAAYVWDYGGGMQPLRCFLDATRALDDDVIARDPGRNPLCRPEPLSELLTAAGLERVETRALDILAAFADFNAYWSLFLGRGTRLQGYTMSLSRAHRDELRELLQARLPIAPDGSIHLTARAWAVRGWR